MEAVYGEERGTGTQTNLVHVLRVEGTVAHGRPERRALAHRRRGAALRGRDTAHVDVGEGPKVVLVEQAVREPVFLGTATEGRGVIAVEGRGGNQMCCETNWGSW